MTGSQPHSVVADDTALQQAFGAAVVPGSARYWAAHFSHRAIRQQVQAIFCFAHLMDQLALASPEVIREKSLWWHEELQRFSAHDSRHPVLQILHQHSQDLLASSLHDHLHGALSTQQKVAITTPDEWRQYAHLRLGSLHIMLCLVAGLDPEAAAVFGDWAAMVGLHGIIRAPQVFTDGRWSIPASVEADQEPATTVAAQHAALLEQRPGPGAAASEVLLRNDSRWWRSEATQASPLYSNAPLGMRGMFHSWQAARATPHP